MRILGFLGLLAVAPLASAARHLPPRNYTTHDYYALHITSSTSPTELAAHLGLEYDGPITALPEHHLFKAVKHDHDIVQDAQAELKRRRRKREIGDEHHVLDSVQFTQKQKLKPRHWKRSVIPKSNGLRADQASTEAIARQQEVARNLQITDPIFDEQWHIFNVQDPGNDINVTDVWMQGITGKGVTACIVDDGLDMDSKDLKDNFFAEGSYDFNDHVDLPKPRLSDDRHGTRCAGEVSAGRNNVCGVGIAYDSKISGVRILSGEITDVDEALAINFMMDKNDIYSCSWGPPDNGQTMQKPGILIQKAMLEAVQKGRGGKGSVYVFAAGNGASNDDDCNFDGYTNSIYSITIGAIDKKNLHPYYSEACSAQLAVTYSSGSGDSIHTTDVGANQCSTTHGGTSAAGPIAVGAYALVLQQRPELSWRDIQWLTVLTGIPLDQPADWTKTSLGRMFSHQFGYGKLDAWALVEKAKTWMPVKPQAWFYSPWMHVKTPIPEGNEGLASVFEVTEEMLKKANLERVEHVTVTMNVEHQRRGDLSVDLISPDGFTSHLSTARRDDDEAVGYEDWTFMSVAHWGEKGVGKWTIIVKDTKKGNGKTGTFTDWKLRLWGESIDAAKAKLFPSPTGHEDDDHDVIADHPAVTTSVALPSSTPLPPVNPSDIPNRPVNQKPATTSAATPSSTSSASSTALPAETEKENFLPSIFPTFGVSRRTQIWIYGALALTLVFLASLGAYIFYVQRKRKAASRDSYEFEMLNDADEDDAGRPLAGAGAGARRGGGRAKRGGELYDAFAGESDEDLLSESENGDEGPYRDRVGRASFDGQYNEKRGTGEGSGSEAGSSEGSNRGKRQ